MRRPPLTIAGVYAILDFPYPHSLAPSEVARAVIDGGAKLVQVRAKSADAVERRRLVEAIAGPCSAAGIPLIVNDDLELAESGIEGVVGVHLGQTDLARLGADARSRTRRREQLRDRGLALGVSTHDLVQLRAALTLDPDYVGFGPVFATTSKVDTDPVVSLEGLARACDQSQVPVVAIGGIDCSRAGLVGRAGASAIAAIGALTGGTVETIRARTFALARAFAD
ncbi:MAG TPA: thiamine phosphate synthase [Enhygromyxa sp.]|nr:thiamine phosphate synthase [Enhygromyxa sp.]